MSGFPNLTTLWAAMRSAGSPVPARRAAACSHASQTSTATANGGQQKTISAADEFLRETVLKRRRAASLAAIAACSEGGYPRRGRGQVDVFGQQLGAQHQRREVDDQKRSNACCSLCCRAPRRIIRLTLAAPAPAVALSFFASELIAVLCRAVLCELGERVAARLVLELSGVFHNIRLRACRLTAPICSHPLRSNTTPTPRHSPRTPTLAPRWHSGTPNPSRLGLLCSVEPFRLKPAPSQSRVLVDALPPSSQTAACRLPALDHRHGAQTGRGAQRDRGFQSCKADTMGNTPGHRRQG